MYAIVRDVIALVNGGIMHVSQAGAQEVMRRDHESWIFQGCLNGRVFISDQDCLRENGHGMFRQIMTNTRLSIMNVVASRLASQL